MMLSKVSEKLQEMGDEAHLEKMQCFGIPTSKAYGIPMPDLRKFAKSIGKDHALALQLWNTEMHEARILASLVDRPQEVTPEQMEDWVADFNAWDVCDQVCSNLFSRTPHAITKALAWSHREAEFVKRAGFSMMAYITVHHKKAKDETFLPFFERIAAEAYDERNFVKKAVNWALRQLGKRNSFLHEKAIETAEKINRQPYRAARWIAKDALRELESEKVKNRLNLM